MRIEHQTMTGSQPERMTVMKGCPSPPVHENLLESASRSESRSAFGIESQQKVSGAILDCDSDTDPDWDEMCVFTVITSKPKQLCHALRWGALMLWIMTGPERGCPMAGEAV
jgi:hypothetical protein